MMMIHNLERLALVLSRTQLRQSLKAFMASSSQEQHERITSIIANARSLIKSFESISVTTLDGKVIALTAVGLFLPKRIVGKNEAHCRWRLFQRWSTVKFSLNTNR